MKITINDKGNLLKENLSILKTIFLQISITREPLFRIGNYEFLAEFDVSGDYNFQVRARKDIRNGNLFIDIL